MKKVIIAAVLLVCLLYAAQCLADDTWYPYFDYVIATEASHGYIESWDDETLVGMAAELTKLANDIPADLTARLNDASLSLSERGKTALDILVNRYGPADQISHSSTMAAELAASPRYWGIDDKAWYTAALERHGLLGADEERHMLPETGDARLDDILESSEKIMRGAFGLDDAALAAYEREFSFRQEALYGDEPVWLVVYANADEGYLVLFHRDGSLWAAAAPGAGVSVIGVE